MTWGPPSEFTLSDLVYSSVLFFFRFSSLSETVSDTSSALPKKISSEFSNLPSKIRQQSIRVGSWTECIVWAHIGESSSNEYGIALNRYDELRYSQERALQSLPALHVHIILLFLHIIIWMSRIRIVSYSDLLRILEFRQIGVGGWRSDFSE